jgi:hypothetical protein
MRNFFPLLFALLAFGIMATSAARAGSPPYVPLQGVLADSSGNPITGTLNLRFALYESQEGGTALWIEQQQVQLDRGVFTVYLGRTSPLDLSLFRDRQNLWLGIGVEGAPEGPRVLVGSVPFSAFAEHGNYNAGPGIVIAGNLISSSLGPSIDGTEVEDGSLSGADLADGSVPAAKLGPSGCAPGDVLKWNGSGWICAADEVGIISCNWDGWRYSGPYGIDCSGVYPGYFCYGFPCLRVNCQRGRITQMEAINCQDAFYPGYSYCPHFYSWTGKEYRHDTTILYRLDRPEKEAAQKRELRLLSLAGQIKARIAEEEAEISYLDAIVLVLVESRGGQVREQRLKPVWASRGLEEISSSDGRYLVMAPGEEVFLIFEPAPALEAGWQRSLFVEAEGYYTLLTTGAFGSFR